MNLSAKIDWAASLVGEFKFEYNLWLKSQVFFFFLIVFSSLKLGLQVSENSWTLQH